MRLTVGRLVRHAYDGTRGTVVRVDRRLGMVLVRFEDGEDWCTANDLRPVRVRRAA